MILVGLGTDDNAARMVEFLAKRGLGISLLNFYGYEHEGQTFLARQMQAEPVRSTGGKVSSNRKELFEARLKAVAERVALLSISALFNEIVDSFSQFGSHTLHPLTMGYSFSRRPIRLPDHEWSFSVPWSIRFIDDEKIRITFLPIAIHLCGTEFTNAKKDIPFVHELPPNAPPTNAVEEQWYCVLNMQEWEKHKDTLLDFASAVYNAWDEAVRKTS